MTYIKIKNIAILVTLTSLLAACSGEPTNSSNVANTAAAPAETIKLKLAHGWPKSYPIFGESVDDYAVLVLSLIHI